MQSIQIGQRGAAATWVPDDPGELLRLAIQVGGIGIYETDFEQDRTRFSPELCAMLGLPEGTEMTHADASLLFHEHDRAEVLASVVSAGHSQSDGRWSGVHRVVRADGITRWVSIHGRRYYRDTVNGRKAVRSIGTVIDVTHLKEAEAAVRDSELRLRLALDAAQMGTFEADIAGTHAIIDEQEAHLLGLPTATRIVAIDELRARMPFEDLRVSDEKRTRLEARESDYHHEFRFRMPDGSERWLCAYAAIRANRIFGVSFDVTERKHAETALRQSEDRLRIATEAAALGVFERDVKRDGTVWANDRTYEILDRTRADDPLTSQQILDYVHPEDLRGVKKAIKDAMRAGGNFHVTCRIRKEESSQRWLQVSGTYELDDAGEPTRHIGVIADVTERKMLEQEAEELAERLANLQEEERRRIAQELHDSTAQHLVAANLNLMSIRANAGPGSKKDKLWDDVEASMHEAMKELRTFSYLMHPPALRVDGLRSTILQFADGYADRSGLMVVLRSTPKIDKLPFKVQRALFRIVQEAFANVHRHASASKVFVDFRDIAGRLHLVITDDGRGMTDTSKPEERTPIRSGVGLRGMEMRVSQFGGKLRVRTGPHGTRIHTSLPFEQARDRKST